MGLYVCPLTIPNGTLASVPLVFELQIGEPYIVQVEIDFATGSAPTGGNSAGIRLKLRNSQFIPSPTPLQNMTSGVLSSADWIVSQGDGAAAFAGLDYGALHSPEALRIEAYNTLAAAVTAEVRIQTAMISTRGQNEIMISELKKLIDQQTTMVDRLLDSIKKPS